MSRPIFWILFLFTSSLFAGLPEATDQEAFDILKKVLKDYPGAYQERKINRIGNKTISFESIVAIESDPKLFQKIIFNVKDYSHWALKNINLKPGGGTYYIKIMDMKPEPSDPMTLRCFVTVDLPVFKHHLQALVKVSPDDKAKNFTVRASMVPDDKSILEGIEILSKVFPGENRPGIQWMYTKAHIVLKNWLLYEALPEKLLKRESGERVQIVLDNYTEEELRLRKNLK